ncbi:hypothetical protein [Alloalcanivorax mobilis]|uniref:hypothetical protein n=1 Tax=Alloalcanivorax mobilis TaxID=2019569 RepID=UPI000B5B22AF|nr:hypothetical protein [Alloalcanivorax mobilis]ASK36075.1 hypothetical protein CEK62_17645 [Alcanivorax sp. N3-2A]|tara:strand:- start:11964 stop:12248 length:285 start_codon:yes stop_codon:yes gene_type:complete
MNQYDDFHLWKTDLLGALLLYGGFACALVPAFLDRSFPLGIVIGAVLVGSFFLRNVKGHFGFFQLPRYAVVINCYIGGLLISALWYGLSQMMLN